MQENTISILTSINATVKQIAQNMAPKNGSGPEATAKLSKGDLNTKADVNPAADTTKQNISTANIGDIVIVLNRLSPSILAVAKLSGSQIKNFKKVLDAVISSINKLSECAKNNKEASESAKKLVEALDILSNGIKKMPNLVVSAPIATLGLKFANGTIKALIGILDTVSGISNVNENIKKLNGLGHAIDPIMNVVLKATALVGICMGLGLLLMLGPTRDLILGGLGVLAMVLAATTVIILLTGLAGKVIKGVGAFAAMRDIMGMVLASALLVTICFGLGMAVEALGGWEPLWKGIAAVGVTLLLLGFTFFLVGYVGKVATSGQVIKGLAGIVLLTFATFVLIFAAKYMADYIKENYEDILLGLGSAALVMVGLIGIGWIATRALQSSKQAVIALAALEVLAVGALGVVFLANKLSKEINGRYDDLAKTLLAAGGVIAGFGVLAAIAGKLQSTLIAGIGVLALLELCAAGAIGVIELMILLDKQKEDYGITWGDLYLDLLAISGVITAFGLLAAAAMYAAPYFAAGIPVIMLLSVMAAGTIGIAHLLINLHNVKEEAGVGWIDLELDVLGVAGIMGTFGVLAAAMSLIAAPAIIGSAALVPVGLVATGIIGIAHLVIGLHKVKEEAGVSWIDLEKDVLGMSLIMGTFGVLAGSMALLIIPIALGTPGMVAVAGFSALVIGVIHSVVNVSKAIDEAGGSEKIVKTLSKDVQSILKNINSDNFSVDMGILTMLGLSAKYAVLSGLVLSILTVAESISKIAQIVGIVDDQGRIRQVLSINKETGEVRYGEPVDIKNLATVIADTVKAFVEHSQYSFEEVRNMYNAAEIFRVLATITEPISKFVEMLTGYVGGVDGAGNNTLAPVHINEKGEIQIGQPVDIKSVATTIAAAISSFVSELYKKENTENWAELIYGDRTFFEGLFGQTNKRADSVREVAGILGIIVDPICKFVDMLVGLEPGADGTLKKVIVDNNGNIKSGPAVNIKTTAGIIADLMTSFITSIYGNADAWDRISEDKGETLKKLLDPINTMIKAGNDLTNEKIDSELIMKNADAIMYANVVLLKSLEGFDANTLNNTIVPIQTLIKLGAEIGNTINSEKILVNSKSITTFMTDVVDKQFPKSEKNINSMKSSLDNLKKSFKSLDDLLIKDEDKRNKALQKLNENLQNIIKTLTENKDAMDSYNTMLDKTTNYTPPQNQPYNYNNNQYQPPYNPNNNGNTYNNTTVATQEQTYSPDDMANAIHEALNGLEFTVSGATSEDTIKLKAFFSGT